MIRLLAVLFILPLLMAADPSPVEQQLALQKAMATARQYLDVNMSAEAVKELETQIAFADGNLAFLKLLREAYLAELYRLEKASPRDENRTAELRRNLLLLGNTAPASPTAAPAPPAPAIEPAPPTMPEWDALPQPDALDVGNTPKPDDSAAEATAAFNRNDFTTAAKLFATSPNLTAEQKAAWAYCRIKLAADSVNATKCDASDASSAIREVNDALSLVPGNSQLQEVGRAVIATATRKGGSAGELTDPVVTDSFRVKHTANRELAVNVAKAAEAKRNAIFARWSGPVSGAWDEKCEIVIHATAAEYAKATGRPAESTGAATVRLVDNRVTERTIHLRADDPKITENALPRELTHVVLADLFPTKPPPRWAEEGMAVLAGANDEIQRYTRTLPRCARDGDWLGLTQLLELKNVPREKVTGFYCESVSLTEYLCQLRGEKHFTGFLRDSQRYGTEAALRRQYNIENLQALESAWKRAALDTGRGQTP